MPDDRPVHAWGALRPFGPSLTGRTCAKCAASIVTHRAKRIGTHFEWAGDGFTWYAESMPHCPPRRTEGMRLTEWKNR